MKVYIHKKLGWKAVESNPNTKGTPVTRNYKIYKSEDSKSYTLRSSLEIEDSEDWEEVSTYFADNNPFKNWSWSCLVEHLGYTPTEVKDVTVTTRGDLSWSTLMDELGSAPPHKELSDDILRLKIKEVEESGFSAGEFTVLAYEWGGDTWASIGDTVFGVQIDGKVFNHRMDAPPADFKDRKILKVRRESDGEIFSVGDMVHAKLNNFTAPILDLYIGNEFRVIVGEDKSNFKRYNTSLHWIQKTYKVEDGYVCEGDPIHMRSPSYYGANIWATGNFVKELLIFTAQPYGIKLYKTPIFNT